MIESIKDSIPSVNFSQSTGTQSIGNQSIFKNLAKIFSCHFQGRMRFMAN